MIVFIIVIVCVVAFFIYQDKKAEEYNNRLRPSVSVPNSNNYHETKTTVEKYESTVPANTFDKEAYDKQNKEKISDFEAMHDLTTVEGILKIPVPQHKRKTEPFSVVSTPEQILQKKATMYKKENKMDLAIACLKKSNQFMKVSWYSYTVKDYMRLVDFLYMNSQFDEARDEKRKIYDYFGCDEVGIYQNIQNRLFNTDEEKADYYEKVIIPAQEELKDREDYYWILEYLPEIAPKSFGGYRRMKNSSSANYIKLKQRVAEKGREI